MSKSFAPLIPKRSLKKPYVHRSFDKYKEEYNLSKTSVILWDVAYFRTVFFESAIGSKANFKYPIKLTADRLNLIGSVERAKQALFEERQRRKEKLDYSEVKEVAREKDWDESNEKTKKRVKRLVIVSSSEDEYERKNKKKNKLKSNPSYSSDDEEDEREKKKKQKPKRHRSHSSSEDGSSMGKQSKRKTGGNEGNSKSFRKEKDIPKTHKKHVPQRPVPAVEFTSLGTRILPWENNKAEYFSKSGKPSLKSKEDRLPKKDKHREEKHKVKQKDESKISQSNLAKVAKKDNIILNEKDAFNPNSSMYDLSTSSSLLHKTAYQSEQGKRDHDHQTQKGFNLMETLSKMAPIAVPNEPTIPRFSFGTSTCVPKDPTSRDNMASDVAEMLRSFQEIDLPSVGTSLTPELCYFVVVQKIAWWFLKWEDDPPDFEIYHPEKHDRAFTVRDQRDDDSDSSSLGYESPTTKLHESSKEYYPPRNSYIDPDVLDEYCGYSSIYTALRQFPCDLLKPCPHPGHENDCNITSLFRFSFTMKPSTNYNHERFEVRCHICKITIKGTRALGSHIRGETHNLNMLQQSEVLIKDLAEPEVKKPAQAFKIYPATLKMYTAQNKGLAYSDLRQALTYQFPGPTLSDNSEGTTPMENKPFKDFQENIQYRSENSYTLKQDYKSYDEKQALKSERKWTLDLDDKWHNWKKEDISLEKKYVERRIKFLADPECHPQYRTEWNEFWYSRYEQLSDDGENAAMYDYTSEWKPIWLKKLQEILLKEAEQEREELLRKFEMDYDSLHKLRFKPGVKRCAPPPPIISDGGQPKTKNARDGEYGKPYNQCVSWNSTGRKGFSNFQGRGRRGQHYPDFQANYRKNNRQRFERQREALLPHPSQGPSGYLPQQPNPWN